MLIIRIEIWPFGYESRKREIAVAKIANTGEGSLERGNYEGAIGRNGRPAPLKDKDIKARGEVKDFPRKSLTAWDLLLRLLVKAIGKKNKTWLQKAVAEL